MSLPLTCFIMEILEPEKKQEEEYDEPHVPSLSLSNNEFTTNLYCISPPFTSHLLLEYIEVNPRNHAFSTINISECISKRQEHLRKSITIIPSSHLKNEQYSPSLIKYPGNTYISLIISKHILRHFPPNKIQIRSLHQSF